MAKYCPIVGEKVIYQFCEDCEEKLCKSVARTNKSSGRAAAANITYNKQQKTLSEPYTTFPVNS